MKHRLMAKVWARTRSGLVMLSVSALMCLDVAGTAVAASLYSFNPSAPASILADTAFTNSTLMDVRDLAENGDFPTVRQRNDSHTILWPWLTKLRSEAGDLYRLGLSASDVLNDRLRHTYLTVAEVRFTFFHVAQTFFELDDPIQSVAVEPVALPSSEAGKPGSSFPSSAVLFALVSFGMIGMVSRSETIARKSHSATESRFSGVARLIGVLSPDPVFARDIEMQLRQAGYDVRVAGSASEIVAATNPTAFMLMVVDHRVQDWDMLRTDPLLRRVSLMGVVPPGHLYTEGHCLSDLDRGLDGVHDFRDGNGLFLARVRAYLRRAEGDVGHRGVYQVGAVQLDADAHEVKIAGREVKLSAKPFAILAALMREPSKVFRRSELVNLIWGPDFAVGNHALDVHVHALRQQLDRQPNHHCRLMTIKGVGFKLKPLSTAKPVLETAVSQSMLPMAANGGVSLNLTVGKRRGGAAFLSRNPLSEPQHTGANHLRVVELGHFEKQSHLHIATLPHWLDKQLRIYFVIVL
ncbi:MAG: response regulator transcription factor [Nitrospira sp.]|nr:response regulator transcription factor [Nitrospira sp.]